MSKKVHFVSSTPVALPRSNSSHGLSSLSKSIIEQESKLLEIDDLIVNMKSIITQYETEIKELQSELRKQNILINDYQNTLEKCKDEIHQIWNS